MPYGFLFLLAFLLVACAAPAPTATPALPSSPFGPCDDVFFFDPPGEGCPADAPFEAAATYQPYAQGRVVDIPQVERRFVLFDEAGRAAMYQISQDVLPAETMARLGEPSGAAEAYTATVQAQGYHPSVSNPKPSYYFTLPDGAIVGAGIDAWWPFGPDAGE